MDLTKNEIAVIGEYCPKLKHLQACFTDETWEALIPSANSGYFKHLLSIPYSTDRKYSTYVNAALALSQSFSSLETRYTISNEENNDDLFSSPPPAYEGTVIHQYSNKLVDRYEDIC